LAIYRVLILYRWNLLDYRPAQAFNAHEENKAHQRTGGRMYTDNPLRVAGPDELPSDNLSRSESMADPDDSIFDSFATIASLAADMEALAATPEQPSIFELARQRDRDEKLAAAMALVMKTSRAFK
jgi:hypothetical protein